MLKFEIESKTIAEFKRLNEANALILQPEYQRKVVWPDQAKVSLMETILLGFPIPEIYLAYETTEDGEETASVVDGQQRLTALIEFIENQYELHNLEDEELRKNFEGLKFVDLPGETRQAFFQYRFPIRRLSNMDDSFVREVFARVNRVNMVLTKQELRNALLPGPFNDFLKDAAEHELASISGLFSGARAKRGGDLEFFAEVFSTCLFGISNKKSEIDERYDRISNDFESFQDRSLVFLELLQFLSNNIKWEGRTRWSNIVDMYTLIEVCWQRHNQLVELELQTSGKFKLLLDEFQRVVSNAKRLEPGSTDELETDLTKLVEFTGLAKEELKRDVFIYLSGVRNSSDLGARRARSLALGHVIDAASKKGES